MTCLKKDEGRRLGIGGASKMSYSVNGSTLSKIALPDLFYKTASSACPANALPDPALLAQANAPPPVPVASAGFASSKGAGHERTKQPKISSQQNARRATRTWQTRTLTRAA